jgi:hypothetical protein
MVEVGSHLEPLKTLHETRSTDEFGMVPCIHSDDRETDIVTVECFVAEIPAKLASKALR